MSIQEITTKFVSDITDAITQQTTERIRNSILAKLDGRKTEDLPTSILAVPSTTKMAPAAKARKKPPLQLCPAPRCPNAAAPVFGMLCRKHKDAKKSDVKKWREARKARKAN